LISSRRPRHLIDSEKAGWDNGLADFLVSFPPSGDIYEKILEETLEQGSRCGKEIMEAGTVREGGQSGSRQSVQQSVGEPLQCRLSAEEEDGTCSLPDPMLVHALIRVDLESFSPVFTQR
jgi:hypothetical protein